MLSIPDEHLPKEFKDEERLDSLFSPFRSRSVNPKDYDTKVATWKTIISLYCTSNGVYSFTPSQLNSLFVRNGRPPSCLQTVVEELVNNEELQPIEQFLKKSPDSWSLWMTDRLVKRPITWSFDKVKSLVLPKVNPNQIYVHLEVVKLESQKLFTLIPEKSKGKVISFDALVDLIKPHFVKDNELKLLLHALSTQKKADIKHLEQRGSNPEVLLLKFSSGGKLEPISEIDIGIYVLEQNEKIFTKHVEEMEDEINHYIKECKEHLHKNHKQLAKTCLRKKHEVQKRLDKKINALHNIQILLEKIKDVHTDATVWQSYKHALSAFSETFRETGLTEDNVEDTMLKLGEVLDVHEDIQSAISRPIQEDTEDLDKELEELLAGKIDSDEPPPDDTSGDLDEELAKLNLDQLPDVPTSDILTQVPLNQ